VFTSTGRRSTTKRSLGRIVFIAGLTSALVTVLPNVSRAQTGIIENSALADDATAIWTNPAGLAMRSGGTTFLSRSFRSDATHTNVLLGGENGGLGFMRTDIDGFGQIDRWRFAIAGSDPRRVFSFGVGGQYGVTSEGHPAANHWSWDLGALVRPSHILSVGVVWRNMRSAGLEPWSLAAGIGVRPIGDRITVFGGATWLDNDGYREPSSWHLGATANVGPGVEIFTSVDNNEVVRAGLSFVFGNGSIGTSSDFNAPGTGPTWATVRFSERYRQTVLTPVEGIAEIDLQGSIEDFPRFSLFGGGATALSSITTQIDRAAKSRDIKAIYLRIRGLSIGQGHADELRAALVEFRENTGKPIICHLMNADMREYYIASAADSVFMEPMGHLNITGYMANAAYFGRMFNKIGLEPQLVRVGEYKAATEAFTDSSLSDEYRSQLESILDDRYIRWIDAVALSRGISKDSIETLVNRGIFTAQDAVVHRLIDATRYSDEVKDVVKSMGRGGHMVNLARRPMYDEQWGPRPRVAIVFASGDMVTGTNESDFITGSSRMGAETIARALKSVREDESISAVVFRIESPGGYALAADIIWREAQKLAESDKPFVVSVANVAASGGYYIAAPADTIVSNPGAIVGSIGIFSGKVSAEELFTKIGVDVEIVQRGENAAFYSVFRPFTGEQLALLQEDVDQGYAAFVDRVSQGRGMTAEEVDSVGRGRVFTGTQGVEAGLVDVEGGLNTAIRIAMEMAKIDGKTELVSYPRRQHFWLQMSDRQSLSSWDSVDGRWFYDPTSTAAR